MKFAFIPDAFPLNRRPPLIPALSIVLSMSIGLQALHAQTTGGNNVPPKKDIYELQKITATPKGDKPLPIKLETYLKKIRTVNGQPEPAPADSDIKWTADKGEPIFDPSYGASVELDFGKPFVKENTAEAKKVTVTATYTGSASVEQSPRTKDVERIYLDFWIAETEDSDDDVLIVRDKNAQPAADDKKVIHWAKVLVKHSASSALPLKLESNGEKKLYFYGEQQNPNLLTADPAPIETLEEEYADGGHFWIGTEAKGIGTGKFKAQADPGTGFKDAPEEKTVNLLPVEVQVRNSTDSGWITSNDLKVAKWEKAWNSSGVFRNDFIDSAGVAEIDRFRILVKGPLPEGQRSFFISSTGSALSTYNDDATELVLTKDPGVPAMGIPSAGFVSKEMILVADASDNRFLNDNMVDDQTHIVALGSDVEFRHGAAAGNPVTKIPVKKKATVNITSYILTPNGGVNLELADKAHDDIRIAREIYTQIGLEITGTVECVPIPAGVNLNDGLLLDTRETRGILSAEALAVLEPYGTPTVHTDVIAIYVDAVIYTDQALIGTCLGMAFPKGWSNAGNFKGTYLVSFRNRNPIVWSHELGHILLNSQGGDLSNHYNIPGNLMRQTTVYTDPSYSWGHTVDTKRINSEQEGYIFGSEFIESLTQ